MLSGRCRDISLLLYSENRLKKMGSENIFQKFFWNRKPSCFSSDRSICRKTGICQQPGLSSVEQRQGSFVSLYWVICRFILKSVKWQHISGLCRMIFPWAGKDHMDRSNRSPRETDRINGRFQNHSPQDQRYRVQASAEGARNEKKTFVLAVNDSCPRHLRCKS